MISINNLINKYREFLLYGIIGGACASLDFVIYTIALYCGVGLLAANTIGVLCGIAASFTLNRQYNFKVKDHTLRRFAIFLSVGLSGLALSSVLLYALVDNLEWNKLYAKLLTIVVVSVFQFVLNKTLTFKVQENG